MARKVPLAPPEIDIEGMRTALPVKANSQWRAMAKNVNYLAGKGGRLAGFNPRPSLTAGSSFSFEGYVWPRAQNQDRLWIVTLAPQQGGSGWSSAQAFGTITDQGTSESAEWTMATGKPQSFYLVARHNSSSSPESTIFTVASDSNSETTVDVLSVQLEELPRVRMETSEGTDDSTAKYGTPIYAASRKSVSGVASEVNALRDVARRNGLFNWSEPVAGVPLTTSAFTGSSNIFAADPAVLARKVRNSSDVLECEVNVYAKVDSGSAEVKVTATSGDTATFTVTNTSANWATPLTLDIDSEHMSRLATDGGLRDGDLDYLTWEGRVTTAGTLTVYAISVGENTTIAAGTPDLDFSKAAKSMHLVTTGL